MFLRKTGMAIAIAAIMSSGSAFALGDTDTDIASNNDVLSDNTSITKTNTTNTTNTAIATDLSDNGSFNDTNSHNSASDTDLLSNNDTDLLSNNTDNSVNDSGNSKNVVATDDSFNSKSVDMDIDKTEDSYNTKTSSLDVDKTEDSYNTKNVMATDDSFNTKNVDIDKTDDSYNTQNSIDDSYNTTNNAEWKMYSSTESHFINIDTDTVVATSSLSGSIGGVGVTYGAGGFLGNDVAVHNMNMMSGMNGAAGITTVSQNTGANSLTQQAVTTNASVFTN